MAIKIHKAPRTCCIGVLTGRGLKTLFVIGLMSVSIFMSNQISADDKAALKQDVQRQLELLNAKTLVERQQAEQRLIELGPNVLPLLPASELVTAVSAKQALKRVRIQLEQTAAKQSIAPSRLTLKADVGLARLTEVFVEQTRNRITLPDASVQASLIKSVSVDWSQRSFWEAIESLEEQRLTVAFSSKKNAYEWTSLERTDPTVTRGAFRIQASPLEVRAPANDGRRLLNARLTISAEPRLRPLLLRYNAGDFALGDDASIPPFDPDARIEVPLGDGGRVSQFSLSFVANKEVPARIALSGAARLVVAAGEEPIEFKDFGRATGVSRRHGGVSVTLTQVRFKRETTGNFAAEVRLQISYDSPQHAFESHQLWVFHNQVYLKNQQGVLIPPTGGAETLFQQDGVVGVEYRFRDLPESARLWSCSYVAPTLLIEVPLEFVLPNVPVQKT